MAWASWDGTGKAKERRKYLDALAATMTRVLALHQYWVECASTGSESTGMVEIGDRDAICGTGLLEQHGPVVP